MNQTKRYILIFIVFLSCLTVVVLIKKNQPGKTAPTLLSPEITKTTSSSVSQSFAYPSLPTVGSISFPKTLTLPKELPVYEVQPLTTENADARVFKTLAALNLASASSRIKQKETYIYQWLTASASASYMRNGFVETLSYQRKESDSTASPSTSLEKLSQAFLERIISPLPEDFSWIKTDMLTSGFEGLILDDPTVSLQEFSFGIMLGQTYPLLFPNQTKNVASVTIDNHSVVRAFSGFLINFTVAQKSPTTLIPYEDIKKRVNARESALIEMTGKTLEPGDTPPVFSSLNIDTIIPAYMIDEKSSLIVPCFLVSGDTNEKGVRLTYLVSALP